MSEIKNTFVGSKMNKDLDSRLIPNGEYREGQNISVSTSEGSDVGALENIRGNIKITDFNLLGKDLEVIGHYEDPANSRIYFFITNFSDSSIDSLRNNSSPSETITLNGVTSVRNGADHYICYCQIPNFQSTFDVDNVTFATLVTGTFLNFSKTHPVLGVNLLEDLLFWTDNRNQPRKINVLKAIASVNHYTTEDHISVAKYAPYNSISFLKNINGFTESTLINEKDEWLPSFFGLPGVIYNRAAVGQPVDEVLVFSNATTRLTDYLPAGNPSYDIRIISAAEEKISEAAVLTIVADATGDFIYLETIPSGTPPTSTPITNIEDTLFWESGTFLFQLRNPYYNASFAGDKTLLEDKFVRFSYRFKFEDNEYSLTAPFSQHAFVPKQYGYFIGKDEDQTRESSTVNFMENQITSAGLVIDLPYSPDTIVEKLKIEEIQLLYKASDEENLKVIKDLKIRDITGSVSSLSIKNNGSNYGAGVYNNVVLTGGSGSGCKATITISGAGRVTLVVLTNFGEGYLANDILTVPPLGGGSQTGSGGELSITLSSAIIYNYNSEKPIKVLPEKEIVRVSDIIPLRAATQEVVGNRVIYGNFLQNNRTIDSLRYSVSKINKGTNTADSKKEFLNHSLKQNRSYQAGIVLQDRYGRSSNVIISEDQSTFNSSFYSDYSNGGIDPLNWGGDSLKITFDELIPTEKQKEYNGIWNSTTNPLGWYTYKVVIKQQEQDYYNVYTAGNLSGDFVFEEYKTRLQYSNTSTVSQIALFNDNINKVPRNLKEVGPSDNVYSSETTLYNRVKQTHRGSDESPQVANTGEQNRNPSRIEIVNVKPFREIGEWTTKKNIDMYYYLMGENGSVQSGVVENTWIYPGYQATVDPFFMKNNRNPLIATLRVSERLGYTNLQQRSITAPSGGVSFTDVFAKNLNVFETSPFKSSIDIYYETSTSGLISDFNNNIISGSGTPIPGGLSDINIEFPETTTVPADISNTFQVVDTQGNALNNSTCVITIESVSNINGSSVNSISPPSSYPVIIQEVQSAAAPSTPPTYKLVNSRIEVFDATSSTGNYYLIKFKVSVNGFADLFVEKEFNLTNVKPIIYRVLSQTIIRKENHVGVVTQPFVISKAVIDNGGLNSFLDSDSSNPITIDYETETGQYLNPLNYVLRSRTDINYMQDPNYFDINPATGKREWCYSVTNGQGQSECYDIDADEFNRLFICYLSHSTNGCEAMTVFDETTDSREVDTTTIKNKDKDLKFNVDEAYRYPAQFKWSNGGKRIYYDKDDTNFPTKDVTSNFKSITAPSLATTNTGVYSLLKFDYGNGSFQNRDFPNRGGNNFKGAFMYYVKLSISDASDQTDTLSSLPFYVKFVIANTSYTG